jgi:HAD superfamily hydrolase (TIGR01509 family)
MRTNTPSLSDLQIAELHRLKSVRYSELVAEGVCPLRPGVQRLLGEAQLRGQRLAIATTTSRGNIDALLSVALGRDWAACFDAIVAGDEVAVKKPAPDVFLEVLSRLKLAPSQCIAVEDSRNVLAAADRAGIPVLVTRSVYFRDEDFSGALLVVDDLTELFKG